MHFDLVCVCVYVCIYIYRERETHTHIYRERERERNACVCVTIKHHVICLSLFVSACGDAAIALCDCVPMVRL